jgi:MoxR-like ATPase
MNGSSDPRAVIREVADGLAAAGYLAGNGIATAVHLARALRKPILVEGPAGVGKTELAKACAEAFGLPLIRLQCYEGLDESKALYDWKYGKQLLYTQILKDTLATMFEAADGLDAAMARLRDVGDVFFSEQFLDARPLLRALREPGGAVLLIDEVDKADEEFEAFLLELLSDYQVTVPEIGTITALVPPLVLLTSNATRELGDALKRRCLHLAIDLPDAALEERIVASRVPEIEARLRVQLVTFVQSLRDLDLRKAPSIGETVDWARALLLLHVTELDADIVRETLNVLLKFEEDVAAARYQLGTLVARARSAGRG